MHLREAYPETTRLKPKQRCQTRDTLRLLEVKTGKDRTEEMRPYAHKITRSLRSFDLSGYVFKKDSPSCGVYRVKVYGSGAPQRIGRGLFACAVMNKYPNLPVEEEGRLNDVRLRENFIERIFAFNRLKTLFRDRWTRREVVEFHTVHKLQLSVHSRPLYRELGQLVAKIKESPRKFFREEYSRIFMEALEKLPSVGRNTDGLQHAAGHLKKILDVGSKNELSLAITDYKKGFLPLIVPITLLKHHIGLHKIKYLENQTFLEPHPKELVLRNHG